MKKGFTQEMRLCYVIRINMVAYLISTINKGDTGMLERSLVGNDWEVRHASLCCYQKC